MCNYLYRFEVESKTVTVFNRTEPTIQNVTLITAHPRASDMSKKPTAPKKNLPIGTVEILDDRIVPEVSELNEPTAEPSTERKDLPPVTSGLTEDKIAQEKADQWFMNASRFHPFPSYSSIEEFDVKLMDFEKRSSIVTERIRISSSMILRLTKEVNRTFEYTCSFRFTATNVFDGFLDRLS